MRQRWSALWEARDWVLCAVVTAVMLIEVVTWSGRNLATGIPFGLMMTLPLAARRWQPIPAFVVSLLGVEGLVRTMPLHDGFGFDNDSATLSVTYFIMVFSLGAHTRGREVWVSSLLIVLAMASFYADEAQGSFDGGDLVFVVFFVGGPWAAGLALRLRSELAASHRLLQEQQEEADPAGDRRGARDHRPGAARRGRARDLGDRPPVARGAADARPRRGAGTPRPGRHRAHQHPGARRHAPAAGRPPRHRGRRRHDARSPRWPGSTTSWPTSGTPVSRSSWSRSARTATCLPASTCRRTGSSRRRSPTCSSTPRPTTPTVRLDYGDDELSPVGPGRRGRAARPERLRARPGRHPRAGRRRRRRDRDRPGRGRRLRGQRPPAVLGGGMT